eukprot:TRINITY_DN25121_c0_g1_i1.p1 TRINITY_DN25121_c0_g1~~TRINITY_DN25121_c0_g1_i1.p1  ORF type:complete len:420 (-),score=67.25 TRINITY_DN25121_c0_g1_i1:121-1380(-)
MERVDEHKLPELTPRRQDRRPKTQPVRMVQAAWRLQMFRDIQEQNATNGKEGSCSPSQASTTAGSRSPPPLRAESDLESALENTATPRSIQRRKTTSALPTPRRLGSKEVPSRRESTSAVPGTVRFAMDSSSAPEIDIPDTEPAAEHIMSARAASQSSNVQRAASKDFAGTGSPSSQSSPTGFSFKRRWSKQAMAAGQEDNKRQPKARQLDPLSPEHVAASSSNATTPAFDCVVSVAASVSAPLQEVKSEWDWFQSKVDAKTGRLLRVDFDSELRRRCHLSPTAFIPSHLQPNCATFAGGGMKFEDFAEWWYNVKYTEEVLITDPAERKRRQLSRALGLSLADVDDAWTIFRKYDRDHSGFIEMDEFKEFVVEHMDFSSAALARPVLQHYMKQVDTDGDGEISFAEFLRWISLLGQDQA